MYIAVFLQGDFILVLDVGRGRMLGPYTLPEAPKYVK